jgi:N-glycosylase/DNA lyase
VQSGRISGIRREDLDLDATLSSGQVFRWERDAQGAWTGVVSGQRRARLIQNSDASVSWEADGADVADATRALWSFFRLDDTDLPALAELWSRADPHFAEAWALSPGIRILRQDPHECFFSFLCASVAPIPRIRSMLRAVADEYGEAMAGATTPDSVAATWTMFPSVAALSVAREDRLRELGLGFRARRVAEAARVLHAGPTDLLGRLRTGATWHDAKRELGAFFGVGEKIADCVCLFSLDKDDAVPVDTHIWRMGVNWYVPELAGRSLTTASYARVVQAFHDRFGPNAGWAQQILFYRAAVGQSAADRRVNSPTARRASSPTSRP